MDAGCFAMRIYKSSRRSPTEISGPIHEPNESATASLLPPESLPNAIMINVRAGRPQCAMEHCQVVLFGGHDGAGPPSIEELLREAACFK
jgi:hypothetical protein